MYIFKFRTEVKKQTVKYSINTVTGRNNSFIILTAIIYTVRTHKTSVYILYSQNSEEQTPGYIWRVNK